MYEILQHDYAKVAQVAEKCYLHMKLVKRAWLHKTWSSPNLLAERSVPEMGAFATGSPAPGLSWVRRLARRLRLT